MLILMILRSSLWRDWDLSAKKFLQSSYYCHDFVPICFACIDFPESYIASLNSQASENTGFTTTRNAYSNNVLLQQSDLVTAHGEILSSLHHLKQNARLVELFLKILFVSYRYFPHIVFRYFLANVIKMLCGCLKLYHHILIW